jgi:hypothetical protein
MFISVKWKKFTEKWHELDTIDLIEIINYKN